MLAIKVITRGTNYIDFEVIGDTQNLYRYIKGENGFKKLFGVGKNNFGKAIRGNARNTINRLVKIVFENNLPFGIIEA
jgi:hypothetical protein